SSRGGAIENDTVNANLTNCTLVGNTAGGFGGGIDTESGGVLRIIDCTLSGNSAGSGGGGFDSTIPLALWDSIVAGKAALSGLDAEGSVAFGICALVGTGSGLTGLTNGPNGNRSGTASTPINPLISPLASYGGPTQTCAVLPNSPAINAGGPLTSLTSG